MDHQFEPLTLDAAERLVPQLREALAVQQQRLDAAAAAAGRCPAEIRLLPVSKRHSAAAAAAAVLAGARSLGENLVQEAHPKAQHLQQLLGPAAPDWVIIGHLQRNKARLVAEFAAEVQSVDSVRLAQELSKRCTAAGRELKILLQVNTSGEPQKSGCAPAELPQLLEEVQQLPGLKLRGLMTMARNSPDEQVVRACFAQLFALRERYAAAVDGGLPELSMGMSTDAHLAIAEGATCVRVGTAIFGSRS